MNRPCSKRARERDVGAAPAGVNVGVDAAPRRPVASDTAAFLHGPQSRDPARLFRIVHSAQSPAWARFCAPSPVRPRADFRLKSLRNNNLLSGCKADIVSALSGRLARLPNRVDEGRESPRGGDDRMACITPDRDPRLRGGSRFWLTSPHRPLLAPPDHSGGHPSETVGEGDPAFLMPSLDGETRFRRAALQRLPCVPAMMPAHTLLPYRRTRPCSEPLRPCAWTQPPLSRGQA